MSLKDWVENKWLDEIPTSQEEITNLLKSADSSLEESRMHTKNLDWQFNIAYVSILNYANAALRASGYRAKMGSHHYYVIQSLAHTINLDGNTVDLVDSFRRIRHIGTYERTGIVSKKDADEIIETATRIREMVCKWLKEHQI